MWTALSCYTSCWSKEREWNSNKCVHTKMILRREMMLSMCFNWIRWIIIITKRHTSTNTFARSIHHHSSILLPFRDPLLRGKVMFAVVMFSFMKRIHSYDEKKEKTHAFEWYAVASSVWTHFVCSYFFSLATLKRSEKKPTTKCAHMMIENILIENVRDLCKWMCKNEEGDKWLK